MLPILAGALIGACVAKEHHVGGAFAGAAVGLLVDVVLVGGAAAYLVHEANKGAGTAWAAPVR
jgi:hypothetical protein